MKLGVCYYPEHWPQERWSVDARLMHQASLSLVRIADFAWALIEPREGEYNWNWLDQAIEVLASENLQIVLCTPTASPPSWLCQAHPDILPVDGQGRRRRFGSRRHYCPNNESYHKLTVHIVTALASRYGRYPALAGWQIDNEFGCHDTARCYCDTCATTFRSWLKEKYKTIDSLNEAWGTIFWSQTYGDWNEIDPPNLTVAEPNPSHVLDYYRFSSDSFVKYQQLQISTLRPLISDGQIVTTNFMSQFTDLDYYDLAKPLNIVTMSSYPTGHAESRSALYMPAENKPAFAYDVGDPYVTGLGHTLMRGFKSKRSFWVMEQQCGNVNWSAYNTGIRPGTVRLWTWHALASGAEAVLYFRWRAGLHAQEQLHSGLLHHDASPAVGYADLETMKTERTLMSEIASEPHEAQVAIVLDYDSIWGIRLQPHNRDFDYMRLLFVYYRALQRLGIPIDIVSFDADYRAYKLVIVPTAYIASNHHVDSLKNYLQNGGTALIGVRSGFKTASNLVTDLPLPGPLRGLVGISVRDWNSLPPGISYDISSDIPGLSGAATIWAEALNPSISESQLVDPTLRILAQYVTGPFGSNAALVENKVGIGRAFYLGWFPNEQQAEALFAYLTSQVGVIPLASVPDGMVVSRRGQYLILLNFTEGAQIAMVQGRALSVASRNVEVVRLDSL